jgi:hypothetical protein
LNGVSHFRLDRIEAKRKRVDEDGEKPRRAPNKIQKLTGVDRTWFVDGAIRFNDLRKDQHMEDLVAKIVERGFPTQLLYPDAENHAKLAKDHEEIEYVYGNGGLHCDGQFAEGG